ncbi:MAG: 3-oxoacyl-ACP synthase [Flavobacteriaceae bacterium]|nr:3-oxoacyl-ACP synthase [Flavobacteriaceae bacterium]
MTLKENLIKQCNAFALERKSHIDLQLKDIKEALFEEMKSSAGDKHETARAMLQMEREKVGNQFKEVEEMFQTLNKIDVSTPATIVHLGSIVFTTKANYFIAISAGKIEVKDDIFYAISSRTPIAKLLMSKQVGNEITFRGNTFIISKIV